MNVTSDSWQTVVLVGAGLSGTLQATTITEDYRDTMPSTGGFTFVNALEGSQPVNVMRGDVTFFAQIGFPGTDGTTPFSSMLVDAGTFDVSVVDASDPTNVLAQQSDLELPENAYTLVALVGTPDNASLFTETTDRSEVQIVRGALPEPGRLPDALRANENLTAFADALQSAGLADMLSGTKDYTIFAPANFAFDNASMSADQQADVLRGYIVEGKYTSIELLNAETLTALNGDTLNITTDSNALYVNNVQVIDLNIPATNGVIYMLNGLLNANG